MTHTHDDYEQIIMILAGKANFWCGDEYYELSEGCIMVVPPHVPHGIQQRTDSDRKFPTFTGAMICPLLSA